MLLFLTVVLGLVSGIAFSASYQLVARFANKNTISLGLGCVGSGIVTLIFQVVLQMGPNPTRKQELILFELTAGECWFLFCCLNSESTEGVRRLCSEPQTQTAKMSFRMSLLC